MPGGTVYSREAIGIKKKGLAEVLVVQAHEQADVRRDSNAK